MSFKVCNTSSLKCSGVPDLHSSTIIFHGFLFFFQASSVFIDALDKVKPQLLSKSISLFLSFSCSYIGNIFEKVIQMDTSEVPYLWGDCAAVLGWDGL